MLCFLLFPQVPFIQALEHVVTDQALFHQNVKAVRVVFRTLELVDQERQKEREKEEGKHRTSGLR